MGPVRSGCRGVTGPGGNRAPGPRPRTTCRGRSPDREGVNGVVPPSSEEEHGQVAFQVIPGEWAPSAAAAEGSPALEEIGPQDQVLRQRKGPGKTEAPGPPLEAAPGPPDSQKGASSQDPLTWFGILVPQSLRQAQSSFKEGILLAGEIASLQSDLEATRAQYQALLERKRQLLAREG
ncbi:coiled-coil domain-containing protein 115 [Macrochelys suwanniensis]